MAREQQQQSTAKRHGKRPKSLGTTLKKAAARHIAKRAGVRTLSETAIELAQKEAQVILEEVVKSAMLLCGHSKKQRLRQNDVHMAIRRTGTLVYY